MTTRTRYTLEEVTQALHDAETDKEISALIDMADSLKRKDRKAFWQAVFADFKERTLQ